MGDVFFDNNLAPISINNETTIRRQSIIGKLIEIIAADSVSNINLKRDPAEIDLKIKHNNLNKFQWVISEYTNNAIFIESAIHELNLAIMNGSTKFKRQMKQFYLESLDKFNIETKPVNMDKLRVNSDNIVQDVIDKTRNFLNKSVLLDDAIYQEDVEYGITLITSYSIIECVVLETPNVND
ncbi:hypothetical protein ACFOSS_14340 [Pseudaeromonas sharmana]|jgi:hypothetical protein|uniref:Uncharacterized protein n=1 Tax=Pseudaeromonas sharmana TaxID=328412 RepID=A0ABV8CS69_9GAMM